MDFRVEIADPAIDDLAEIVSYIAQHNPEAASALGNHLLDAALSLAQTPHKGSPYRQIPGNVRKLTVQPFKIFYRVNESKQASRFFASGTPPDASQSSEPNSGIRMFDVFFFFFFFFFFFPAAGSPLLSALLRHSPAQAARSRRLLGWPRA